MMMAMADHHAPPCGPDGNNLGIPRNEQGFYQPTSWMQLYALWMGMATGAIQPEPAFDLSLLPKVLTADEIVSAQPMTAPVKKWWKDG